MNVFAVGLLIQVILVRYAGMGHVTSYIAQTVTSVQLNFLLSRYLTWRDRNVPFLRALARFNVQQLAITGIGMAGYAGLERLGVNYITANVVVTAALAPMSFLSSHLWSLSERHRRGRRVTTHSRRARSLPAMREVAPTDSPVWTISPRRARYLPAPIEVAAGGGVAAFVPPVLLPKRPPTGRARVVTVKVACGLRGSFSRHHVDVLVLSALLLIAGFAQAWNMWGWPAWGDDEGTYVAQAWAVQFKGVLAPYTYWYDHPPAGWLQMAGFDWLTGALSWAPSAVDAGRVFILMVGIISAGLVYVLARRLGMRYGFAAAAVGLFVFSPLALYYHRMVYLDNIEVMWALAAFVLALSPKRRLWAFAGSGACVALSALSKETGLLLLPGLVVLVWQRADRHTRRFCFTLFAVLLVLGGSTYLLYAALKGELLAGSGHVSLQQGLFFQLGSRSGSGSVWNTSSAAHATVVGWLQFDTWLPAAGLIASVPLLANRRLRAIAVTVALQALLLLRHGYLPNPYIIAALPFCALALAGLVDLLWGWRPSWGAAADGKTQRILAAARMQAGPAAALVVAAIFTVGAAPAWARSDHDAMTFQATAPYIRAEQWIVTHIPANARLITDDTMWVDLTTRKFGTESQRGGFYSAHVVWFWKLGTDPAVDRRFPQSWRDFNYIISTPTLRATVQQALPALAALQHSIVVKRFGRSPSVPGNPTMTDPGTPLSQQPDRIEIRLIEPNR